MAAGRRCPFDARVVTALLAHYVAEIQGHGYFIGKLLLRGA
jgi:hypothetical protein